MLSQLRAEVLAANLALVEQGLVRLTWGNASGIDRERGLVVIKPSGVDYRSLDADDLVVVDLQGRVVEGDYRPSTDTPTHLVLYRNLDRLGGVVHTHSTWATAWAQARRPIPVLGTTHADLSPHPVPVTRALTAEEVSGDYEAATGEVVLEAMAGRGPEEVPAVLVAGHGPFTMGSDPAGAAAAAVTLEQVAEIALLASLLEPTMAPIPGFVTGRHFSRKHGADAYYGQSR